MSQETAKKEVTTTADGAEVRVDPNEGIAGHESRSPSPVRRKPSSLAPEVEEITDDENRPARRGATTYAYGSEIMEPLIENLNPESTQDAMEPTKPNSIVLRRGNPRSGRSKRHIEPMASAMRSTYRTYSPDSRSVTINPRPTQVRQNSPDWWSESDSDDQSSAYTTVIDDRRHSRSRSNASQRVGYEARDDSRQRRLERLRLSPVSRPEIVIEQPGSRRRRYTLERHPNENRLSRKDHEHWENNHWHRLDSDPLTAYRSDLDRRNSRTRRDSEWRRPQQPPHFFRNPPRRDHSPPDHDLPPMLPSFGSASVPASETAHSIHQRGRHYKRSSRNGSRRAASPALYMNTQVHSYPASSWRDLPPVIFHDSDQDSVYRVRRRSKSRVLDTPLDIDDHTTHPTYFSDDLDSRRDPPISRLSRQPYPYSQPENQLVHIRNRLDMDEDEEYISDTLTESSLNFSLNHDKSETTQERSAQSEDEFTPVPVQRTHTQYGWKVSVQEHSVMFSRLVHGLNSPTLKFNVELLTANTPTKLTLPLFRWAHIEAPLLSVNSLESHIRQLSGLTEKEKSSIQIILENVQHLETPFRTDSGISGRQMEPNDQEYIHHDCFSCKGEENCALKTSVRFMCFPYFAFSKYSTEAVLKRDSHWHPTRTLLQAHFPSVEKGRDLKQAVCSLPEMPSGYCFHVPQMWSLIVNERYLITYAPLTFEALRDDIVKVIPQLPLENSLSSSILSDSTYIQFSDGGRSLWLIALKKCETWFMLTANFLDLTEDFERQFIIVRDGKIITREMWPSIVSEAKRTQLSLVLKRKRLTMQNPRDWWFNYEALSGEKDYSESWDRSRENLSDLTTDSAANGTEMEDSHLSIEESTMDFHVFSRLAATQSRSILFLLAESQKFLRFNTTRERDKTAYKHAAHKVMKAVRSSISGDQSINLKRHQFYEAAKTALHFFAPARTDSPVLNRYWGAVDTIIKMIDYTMPKSLVIRIRKFVSLAEILHSYIIKLSGPGGIKADHTIPEEWIRAWPHVVMSLVHIASAEGDHRYKWSDSLWHSRKSIALIEQGYRSLVKSISKIPFAETKAALPNMVLCFLASRLARDVSLWNGKIDIAALYGDYYKSLNFTVKRDPVKRSHQSKLVELQLESKAIQEVLEQQTKRLQNLAEGIRDSAHRYQSLDSDCKSLRAVNHTLSRLDHRRKLFEKIDDNSDYLQDLNLDHLATAKDRQEASIVIFTTVTVIFLPLSFLTSYFGMNTIDIRNMELRQWVFWSVAIPFTATLLVILFHLTGELGNAFNSVKNLFPNRRPHLQPMQWPANNSSIPQQRHDYYYQSRMEPPGGPLMRVQSGFSTRSRVSGGRREHPL